MKKTDAYRFDLEAPVGYRRSLIRSGDIADDASSILIVVGREETGGLEAQIRGSRYAWHVRLITVDALLRLLRLKEATENPRIHHQIRSVLVPREFTKLDGISAGEAYVALGCGSERTLLLIPFREFAAWLDGLWTTESEDRFYWHVHISRERDRLVLDRKRGHEPVDVTRYLLPEKGQGEAWAWPSLISTRP